MVLQGGAAQSYSTVDCRGRNGACAGIDLREVKKEEEKEKGKRRKNKIRRPRECAAKR
jgi:hypothetical protein